MPASILRMVSAFLLLTMAAKSPVEAKSPSLQGGKITSTSVQDNSGSQEQTGSVGSGSYGSSVGDGEVGVKHILHFSDVHLNISESLDANESSEIPIQYGYDAPISLLTSALEYAKQVLPDPDFFLYTGDHAVHGDPSDEYLAEAVKVNVETMAQYFSGFGNETLNATAILGDTDTKNYTMNVTDPATEENPTIEMVSPAWSDSLNATNLQDLNTRGYLSYKIDEKLVLLTLNTVPYSPNHSPDTSNETDPFDQFAWLNATLAGLRNGGKFAYIAGHIPPIIDAQDGSPMWEASYLATYKTIVTQFADVVKAQIFGHTHSVEFRLPLTSDMESQDPADVLAGDNSDQSAQLVPLFMSAAISPIFYSNPAFMVWDFDPSSYDLLDFTVYGTNLSEASNGTAALDWQPLFRASTAYNVSSLSWADMNNFIVDAASDSALVEQYYYNSQAQSYLQTACEDSVCRTWYLCSMLWWSTPEDYTACLAAGSRLESTSAAAAASSPLTTTLVSACIAMLALVL
ncbi:Acid sphingomyelinase-like phosphodiesterase 3a [Phytophthora pseudosyringae]|uniref:Acid sphingomyelinase-like phosphodiesterase 3a n=1 Tax=Phytophthora pseudosyringae TaxID=221518 RepID=A0A8T1VEL8_9STRA|nr:Acid sphingomyelinase-like phosphodiesterase 3a [Phytophthora pseudosyringae]